MTSKFELRSATEAEFSTAVDWAKSEGWNPGLQDIEAFFRADPDGFIMGFLDDRPISSISVVRYGNDYGFLGFYIVHPDFRSQGYGLQTWNTGMNHLRGRIVGLDGVVAQQENYAKSGFELYGRNIRYFGMPEQGSNPVLPMDVCAVQSHHHRALMHYDSRMFGRDRKEFLKHWISQSPALMRWSFVHTEAGDVSGYATIRKCFDGYKIGPLFADNESIAQSLFRACLTKAAPNAPVTLDVPEKNTLAIKLAQSANLLPVFETARMYQGVPPVIPTESIYGVTTFELG